MIYINRDSVQCSICPVQTQCMKLWCNYHWQTKVLITLKPYVACNYWQNELNVMKMQIESVQEMYSCIVGVENIVCLYNKCQTASISLLAFVIVGEFSEQWREDLIKTFYTAVILQWKIHWHPPMQTGLNQASLTRPLIINTFFMNSWHVKFIWE